VTIDKNSPQLLLLDLAKELDGETLEETFTLFGHQWTISLLSEEESNWRNSFLNTGSTISTMSSWRLPTLAIGIRKIDGISVYQFFSKEWEATEEGRQVRSILEGKGRYSQKYFAAEHLMQFLADRFPDKIEELWLHWATLEKRREEAQDNVKKSSGEASDESTDESGTEPSPSGDQ